MPAQVKLPAHANPFHLMAQEVFKLLTKPTGTEHARVLKLAGVLQALAETNYERGWHDATQMHEIGQREPEPVADGYNHEPGWQIDKGTAPPVSLAEEQLSPEGVAAAALFEGADGTSPGIRVIGRPAGVVFRGSIQHYLLFMAENSNKPYIVVNIGEDLIEVRDPLVYVAVAGGSP